MTTISLQQYMKDNAGMIKPTTELVAVYGTLKMGLRNSHLIPGRPIHYGKTKDKYLMTHNMGLLTIDKCYPIVCINPTDRTYAVPITVEVYGVSSLTSMDKLEQYPELYKRSKVMITNNLGVDIEAWLYHSDDYQQLPVVESGNWLTKAPPVAQQTRYIPPKNVVEFSSVPFVPFHKRNVRSSFEEEVK